VVYPEVFHTTVARTYLIAKPTFSSLGTKTGPASGFLHFCHFSPWLFRLLADSPHSLFTLWLVCPLANSLPHLGQFTPHAPLCD